MHGNHLGVPIVTTNANGTPATTPNDYLAPGFPGQSRTIADLYYNRYRDYDPTTGRYVQADPIGLGGGQNGYVYAANNPIGETDPMGLMGHGAGPTPRRRKPPTRDCPDKPKAPQPFPMDWPSYTWRQVFCSISAEFAGVGAIGTDVACRTEYTGNNPNDPRNANRKNEATEKYLELFSIRFVRIRSVGDNLSIQQAGTC